MHLKRKSPKFHFPEKEKKLKTFLCDREKEKEKEINPIFLSPFIIGNSYMPRIS